VTRTPDPGSRARDVAERRGASRLRVAVATLAWCTATLGLRSAFSLAMFYTASLTRSPRRERHMFVASVGRTLALRAADMGTMTEVFFGRHYDLDRAPRQAAAFHAYARSVAAPLIIDCGANIGLSAVWFRHRFPTAAIYAIEPAQENVALMQQNIRGLADIHLVSGAVWHEPAMMAFDYRDDNPPGAQLAASGERQVRCYAIAEIIEMAGGRDPLIVKIDIEGAERGLFSGNTDWVKRTKLIIIETHDWLFPFQGSSLPFWLCMARERFDIVPIDANIFCFNRNLATRPDRAVSDAPPAEVPAAGAPV
jgi:FkbM family methyltransferase